MYAMNLWVESILSFFVDRRVIEKHLKNNPKNVSVADTLKGIIAAYFYYRLVSTDICKSLSAHVPSQR